MKSLLRIWLAIAMMAAFPASAQLSKTVLEATQFTGNQITGGTNWAVKSGGITTNLLGLGTVSAPAWSFKGFPNVGFYSSAGDIDVATGGTLRWSFTGDQLRGRSAISPIYGGSSGLSGFEIADTQIGLFANNSFPGFLRSSGWTMISGSTAAPILSLTTQTNTGIFFPSTTSIGFSIGGTEEARVGVNGIERINGVTLSWPVANAAGLWKNDGAGVITFATALTADIADDQVTYAKIQNVTDARLIGRSAGSAGDMQEITVGSGLSLSAGSLTATATATRLNEITAANGNSSIDNAANTNEFKWALTGATQRGFSFRESAASINGAGSQSLVTIETLAAGSSTANPLSVFVRGTETMRIPYSDPQIRMHAGSTIRPSYSFLDNITVGMDYTTGSSTVNFRADADTYIGLTSTTMNFYNGGATMMTLSANQILGVAGSAGTPAIAFAGDVNTGIFNQAADKFSVAANGTEEFRVGANGIEQINGVNLTWPTALPVANAHVNISPAGAISYSSASITPTPTRGSGFPTIWFAQTNSVTVTNSTAERSIIVTNSLLSEAVLVDSMAITAHGARSIWLDQGSTVDTNAIGATIKVHMRGYFYTQAAPGTLTIRVGTCDDTVAPITLDLLVSTGAITLPASVSGGGWSLDFNLQMFPTTFPNGFLIGDGVFTYTDGATDVTYARHLTMQSTTTEAMHTVYRNFLAFATFSVASGNSITSQFATVTRYPAVAY